MMFSEVPDIEITNIESKESERKLGTEEVEQRLASILDKTDHLRIPAVDDDFHAIVDADNELI